MNYVKSRIDFRRLVRSLAGVLIAMVALVGCGNHGPSGTYRSPATNITIEFLGGEKFRATVMGKSQEGTYTVGGGDVLLTIGNDVQTAKLSEDGRTLTLTTDIGTDVLTKQ